jgi:GTPase
MSLIDIGTVPKPIWEFEAHIRVMQHATSIKDGYNAVAHVGGITQSVEILEIKDMEMKELPLLRSGNMAIVRFRFLYRAELIKTNLPVLFREGSCMICGWITSVFLETEKEDA